jgi:hypothetical protein
VRITGDVKFAFGAIMNSASISADRLSLSLSQAYSPRRRILFSLSSAEVKDTRATVFLTLFSWLDSFSVCNYALGDDPAVDLLRDIPS